MIKMPDEETSIDLTQGYSELLSGIIILLDQGRQAAARSVNSILTATYWLVGRRLVEHEQRGEPRAAYGTELLKRLSRDLLSRVGRGFSERNLEQMRQFYLQWQIPQTLSANFHQAEPSNMSQTSTANLVHDASSAPAFPLSWSHYVRLLTVAESEARRHYEVEAIRGGWSVRQLDRQISTLAYQRSRSRTSPSATIAVAVTADSEIKDPFVLEFLGLKGYSESELEDSLIRELEQFLMELGNDFAFIARQRRLRVGTEWYRVDLLFFHRRLRSLIVIDLLCGRPHYAERF